jgi:hypothetical protein
VTTRRAASGEVRSCVACLGWGTLLARGLCVACTMFARDHAVGECIGCQRRQPIRKQYCRLCWCQARTQAKESGEPRHTAKAVYHLHRVRQHQLFFANMLSTRGAATTPPRRYDRRGRPRKPPPAPAGRPATRWVQPLLFDGLRRDYTRFDERQDVDLDNPWLWWGQHLAYRLGEARGWSGGVRAGVARALIIVLSSHADGDVVFYSAMSCALRALQLSCERTAEVLDQMGILIDDRRPSFEDWLDGKLEGSRRVSPVRSRPGFGGYVTAALAPGPATSRPSGSTQTLCDRSCCNGQPPMITCRRSAARTCSPPCSRATVRTVSTR